MRACNVAQEGERERREGERAQSLSLSLSVCRDRREKERSSGGEEKIQSVGVKAGSRKGDATTVKATSREERERRGRPCPPFVFFCPRL